MDAPQSSSNKLRRVLVVTIYVASLAWGVIQVILPDSAGLHYLIALTTAGAAASWVASDARDRGKPILHILQLLTFLFWPIAVPAYLIGTRGFRGLGLTVVHVIGLTLVLCLGFYVTVFSVYGLDVYANQP